MLRIGRIPWLVCAPYFHKPLEGKDFKYIDAPPAQLSKMLISGEIDLAPTSSILFCQHPDKLKIINHLSTSGPLEVKSVALFCKTPYQPHASFKIWLTPDSGTSIKLMEILLTQNLNWNISFVKHSEEADGLLLIGDEGLAARDKKWHSIMDLASLWLDWQKKPFVFGLWLVNNSIEKDTLKKSLLKTFVDTLKQNTQAPKEDILNHWQKQYPLPCEYNTALNFLNTLDYQLDTERLESLKIFYKLCHEQGWSQENPKLKFLNV